MAVLAAVGGSVVFWPPSKEKEEEGYRPVGPVLYAIAQHAKPTVLASPSRFLRQVKDEIEVRYGTSFLYRRGLEKKREYFQEGRLVTDSKYDMLVFRDIRQRTFGGGLRLVLFDNDGNIYFIYIYSCDVVVVRMIHSYEGGGGGHR